MARLVATPGSDPARFGLFSVATLIDDPRIAATGAEWESYTCGAADVVASVCEPGTPPDPQGGPGLAEAVPFTVVASYLCSAMSRPVEDAYTIVRQRLAFAEDRAVGVAIGSAVGSSLAAGTDLTPAGGPTTVTDGVGLLEQYLASVSGTVGTIHTPRYAAGAIVASVGVERVGQHLETPVGTLVAASGGYDIVQAGQIADDGTATLYATGRLTIWRSDVAVSPDEDQVPARSNNDVLVTADRQYAVGWDCPPASVQVQIRPAEGADDPGGSSPP